VPNPAIGKIIFIDVTPPQILYRVSTLVPNDTPQARMANPSGDGIFRPNRLAIDGVAIGI
jgi:hypothetical protein